MADVKHRNLGEVRMTIRNELHHEKTYLDRIKDGPFARDERVKTKATIQAYQAVLHWLADLEV